MVECATFYVIPDLIGDPEAVTILAYYTEHHIYSWIPDYTRLRRAIWDDKANKKQVSAQ